MLGAAICGIGFGMFQTPNNLVADIHAPSAVREGRGGKCRPQRALRGQTLGAVVKPALSFACRGQLFRNANMLFHWPRLHGLRQHFQFRQFREGTDLPANNGLMENERDALAGGSCCCYKIGPADMFRSKYSKRCTMPSSKIPIGPWSTNSHVANTHIQCLRDPTVGEPEGNTRLC